MRFYEQIRRIERIDQLIRLRATGEPSELAKKLAISESQLYEVLRIMRDELGGPIFYSKTSQNYYYPGEIKFKCTFEDSGKDNSLNVVLYETFCYLTMAGF